MECGQGAISCKLGTVRTIPFSAIGSFTLGLTFVSQRASHNHKPAPQRASATSDRNRVTTGAEYPLLLSLCVCEASSVHLAAHYHHMPMHASRSVAAGIRSQPTQLAPRASPAHPTARSLTHLIPAISRQLRASCSGPSGTHGLFTRTFMACSRRTRLQISADAISRQLLMLPPDVR